MVDSSMVVLDDSVLSENEASINCGGASLSQVPTVNISQSSVYLNGLFKKKHVFSGDFVVCWFACATGNIYVCFDWRANVVQNS